MNLIPFIYVLCVVCLCFSSQAFDEGEKSFQHPSQARFMAPPHPFSPYPFGGSYNPPPTRTASYVPQPSVPEMKTVSVPVPQELGGGVITIHVAQQTFSMPSYHTMNHSHVSIVDYRQARPYYLYQDPFFLMATQSLPWIRYPHQRPLMYLAYADPRLQATLGQYPSRGWPPPNL